MEVVLCCFEVKPPARRALLLSVLSNPRASLGKAKKKTAMGSVEKGKKKKSLEANPNWAQIRQKLNTHGTNGIPPLKFKETAAYKDSHDSAPSILGKRKERPSSDFTSFQPDVLLPTSSDSSVTKEIAMDCEMVGVTSQGNKSALGRVTLVNKWGNVIYDEFVCPVERVVNFRTQISGIRPRDLWKAKDFRVVQKTVADLIKGKILVGHALRNDLKALLLSHPKKDIRDTSEYPPFLKESRRKALRHLAAEFLKVQIQNGEHCPVEDARAAMMLYQRNRRDWERWVKDRFKLKEKQKRRKKKKPAENDAENLDDDGTEQSE